MVCSEFPNDCVKVDVEFKAHQEGSIVPVWVIFPELRLPFFQKNQSKKLASTLGRLLRIDSATEDLRCPSVVRVLVEVNVTRPPIKRIWIGDEEFGFWQQADFKNWLAFCQYCEHFGYDERECFCKNPALKAEKPEAEK